MNTLTPVEHCSSPPYPQPSSIQDTKANLKFFRAQAGMRQEDVARVCGIPFQTYQKYESVASKSAQKLIMPPHHVQQLSELFKCDSYLIDPATPYNRENPSDWPAFFYGGSIRTFSESPSTYEEYASNLRYLIHRAGYSLAQIAHIVGCSKSAINRWATQGRYAPESAVKVLQALGCPELLPYVFPRRGARMDNVVDPATGAARTLILPPMTLKDLKNNLIYHLKSRGIMYVQADSDLRVTKGTVRRFCDPALRTYLDPMQAEAMSILYGFNLADISPNSLFDSHTASNAADFTSMTQHPGIMGKHIGALAAAGPASPYAESQTKETFGDFMHLSSVETSGTVTVVGDSMYNHQTGEGLPAGSLAFIDMSRCDVDKVVGEPVCWRTQDGDMMIKRLVRKGKDYYLESDNPDITPHRFPVPYGAVLLGVVTGFAKRL